jgi:hypothetical protein
MLAYYNVRARMCHAQTHTLSLSRHRAIAVVDDRTPPALVTTLHSVDVSIALAHPSTSTFPLDIVVRHDDVGARSTSSAGNSGGRSSGAFRIDLAPAALMLALVRIALHVLF